MVCDARSYAVVQSLIWVVEEGLTVARIAKTYTILCEISVSRCRVVITASNPHQ